MKSSIKIAFGVKNTPEIHFQVSDDRLDIRDQLCAQFVHELTHTSNFCIIEPNDLRVNLDYQQYRIIPVGGNDLIALRDRVDAAIKHQEHIRKISTEQ